MRSSKTRGFTLVELLVVITIIGMLMAMLFPAVNAAREAANRATCQNNQSQLGKALLQYEAANGRFPGYVNRLGPRANETSGNDASEVSWVVMILPFLDRNDLYGIWSRGWNGTTSERGVSNSSVQTQARRFLKVLTCPTDPPDRTGASDCPRAYTVNCGRTGRDPGPTFTASSSSYQREAFGVFHDNGFESGMANRPFDEARVTLDYIAQSDGASSTLMVGENVKATGYEEWVATNDPANASRRIERFWSSKGGTNFQMLQENGERGLGFVWRESAGSNNFYKGMVTVNYRIAENTRGTTLYPGLASYHGGGANVIMCDGHGLFLRDTITPEVYIHLMTPNGRAVRVGNFTISGILSDGDYK